MFYSLTRLENNLELTICHRAQLQECLNAERLLHHFHSPKSFIWRLTSGFKLHLYFRYLAALRWLRSVSAAELTQNSVSRFESDVNEEFKTRKFTDRNTCVPKLATGTLRERERGGEAFPERISFHIISQGVTLTICMEWNGLIHFEECKWANASSVWGDKAHRKCKHFHCIIHESLKTHLDITQRADLLCVLSESKHAFMQKNVFN